LTAEHQAVHEIRADETLALRARIAELEAENEELKKAISKPWMGSARAAYRGDKE
jgi:cell division protein FtsB